MVDIPFFLWLLFAVAVYWIIQKQVLRLLFLSAISFVFISYLDKNSALLVLLLSLFSYGIAYLIENTKHKALFHGLGIVCLLAVLIIFKYLGLLTNVLNDLHGFINFLPAFHIEKLILPLGLSYLVFKYISYITDVYWEITSKGNFLQFLCYGSLFTTYVAGPIERFTNLHPQLIEKQKFSSTLFSESIERIIYGIFKKVVLADWIGYFILPILKQPNEYSFIIQVVAMIGFSIQIYIDFSAYSDIAIGSSRLFGFKIMENFNWPYLQPNIAQFWRCWHISLSSWIRDYVFFPLSRWFSFKFWNMIIVPIIAMGLCGLWHGASWGFLIWGMLHGAALAIFQMWTIIRKKNKVLAKVSVQKWFNLLSILITFAFITVAWRWFK